MFPDAFPLPEPFSRQDGWRFQRDSSNRDQGSLWGSRGHLWRAERVVNSALLKEIEHGDNDQEFPNSDLNVM